MDARELAQRIEKEALTQEWDGCLFDIDKCASILSSALQPQWVKTSERLPEVGIAVLVSGRYSLGQPHILMYLPEDNAWPHHPWRNVSGNTHVPMSHVTHWMPLPNVPTEEKTNA